ncbi:Signal transduction histidine kinase [Nannocystis exedens]|uniref:histidine kinase n=1 Tax=Nannocystis exedens TaxID=54 RepID=A0A1I2HFV2_9BACT|nr:ATP-binding protein [Nannocystis exedens]PCC67853.1 sensor histidine kinase [Nannocystis exedens]SFF27787.1 Signal transduction histidine kinase [Nannocystis exedens]
MTDSSGHRPGPDPAADPLDPRIAALLRAAVALAPDAAAYASDPRAAAETALAVVAAELAALRAYRERTERQMEELFNTITAFAALDYDRRALVHDDNDELINAMAIGLNMMGEELSHTMKALVRARDEALAASRAKSAFLANISHELRTPLNAIIGYAEIIREDLVDAGQEALTIDVDRLQIASRHLLNLIQDVLDLARIEAGRVDVRLELVDLRTLLHELQTTLAPSVKDAGNVLHTRVELERPLIHTDPLRLQQILLNILGNANKFTVGGDITLSARDHDEHGRAFVDITVTDTGIGIPADKLESIFDAFTQVDDTSTRRFGGTGLGLAISRRLCDLLGGTIVVTSELRRGSTFRVRLPVDGPQPR